MTFEGMQAVPAEGASVAEVFEYVYSRYQRRITHLIYGMVGEWATAEDLTADMFTALWRHMSQRGFVLEDPQRAYTLLALRARSVVLNHFSTARQRREHLVRADESGQPTRIEALAAQLTTDGPETTVVSHADLAAVINILPDPQQRVILLRYLLDMAPDQVAAFTGWPPTAVSFHTTRALSALRAAPGVSETLGRDETAPATGRRIERGPAPASFAPTLAARDTATAERRQRTEEMLLERIYSGELAPGSRLPSTRAMSAWCGLSKSGICRVLGELTERGVLTKDVAGQYYVTAPDGAAPALLGEQAVEKLRAHLTGQLDAGTLSAGQALPGRRPLAAALGMNPNTINTALAALTASRFLAKNQAGRYTVAA